jgi:hypothetical protein
MQWSAALLCDEGLEYRREGLDVKWRCGASLVLNILQQLLPAILFL